MNDTIYALLAIAMVLLVVSVLVPLAERFRLPHTVLLAIAGMGMGFLGSWIIAADVKWGALGDAFVGLDKLEVGTDVFLPLFLPPLLFTAGLTIDVRRLMDEIHAVLLLAIVAVLVCIACVAGVVHVATGIDLVVCLLLGAVVSTTDPAAVIGIFRDVGAPKRLSILAEGESLLNDAVAIAAFGLFIGIIASRSSGDPLSAMESSPMSAVGVFLREFIGGLLLGFVMARAAMVILPRLGESDAAIASVTVSLCYLSFVIADRYLHVSGVVSVVMAALTVAAYGPTHLHPRQWTALRQIWTQLEFWANCLIFVLASMLAANVLLHITWLYAWGVAAVAVGAFSARALVVFGMLPVLEATKLVQPVDKRYKAILVWGGLRGAVTIVLAMVAAGDLRLPLQVREFIAISAVLFVLFTLFVNATTLGLVMHLLGLDKLSRLELALRDRVLALSRVNVARHLQQIMRQHNARTEGIDVDPASAGAAEVEAVPEELALDLDERVKIGLVTLCTREKELYLELFEQQILSRRMVAVLAARADRLIDRVRDRGVAGYEEWLDRISRPDLGFRVALWLHRRIGIEGMVTERLADRFEILMVSQSVLGELAAFNITSVADLLGPDAEARLAALIGNRQTAVDSALRALSLQYPGYAESIEVRQLERAAIRFESAEYARRLREGIISREVYNNLRDKLAERRGAISQRPPLDLGLELAAMIGRVSLFAALDRETIVEVGKRLRALVALPGEKIIAVGGTPDAMYFVAAGEVTVHAGTVSVRLKEGDFFGEMGLLSAQPRSADVVADGYCHLLVLYKKDFNQLLARRPEVRAEIEAVAARRVAENLNQNKAAS
ncbi:MAG: cyclic nucleotide-binding domain-containing protein [Reyranella sp.]|uniref:cation:proton antiporter n=1 Tax=Reyranella sp. TaxID=1929291 RepID=UPI00120353AA|nr:cation:proton antiporter [Reyranella sp.]TAJ42023.1 MAG: cyclic nucleotide-binding domain-containing protein [Reyranella sp.]